jgi:hypothetical protein
MAKQTLNVRIVSCGGTQDLMSELEATFLASCLGLFRTQMEMGRATPRAKPTLIRAYKPADFLAAIDDADDLLHLIAHGTPGDGLQVGIKTLYASALKELAEEEGLHLPPIVVSTMCGFSTKGWHETLRAFGVKIVIATSRQVPPGHVASFDMAFYSALLSRIYKGHDTNHRVRESFKLANEYYNKVYAVGSGPTPFQLTEL